MDQPSARRRPPLRVRGDRRQELRDETLPCPRAWSRQQDCEAMEPPDGGGARARGNGVLGQKVNPIGLRLGINRNWDSRWFADDSYADLLHEELRIRKYLRERLQQAGVSPIVIERPAKQERINLHTASTRVEIGKK